MYLGLAVALATWYNGKKEERNAVLLGGYQMRAYFFL